MPNLALFDFDGTISLRDNFSPFIYYSVDPLRLALGKVFLSPLLIAYKLGILSASDMRQRVARFGFRGRSTAEIQEMGLTYSVNELPKFIRPLALERIQWHKAQGDVVVVVSASLEVYLADWCKQQELHLICTRLESKDGVLTGGYHQGDCAGAEKLRRIREKFDIGDFQVVYAYGDTAEDREMMSIAHKAFFCWQELPN